MMARVLELPRELGALGIAALVLLAGAALFRLVALAPLNAQSAQFAEPVTRQAPAPEASTAERVGAVYAFLKKDEQATDWLAKLHGISAGTGVQTKSATYRSQPTDGRILRYEIVLPVTGTYPQIRDFLRRSLDEIPVLSLDQLSLKRESRKDGTLHAELRMTLHMVKA